MVGEGCEVLEASEDLLLALRVFEGAGASTEA